MLHLSAAICDKPNSKPTRVYCKHGKEDEVIIASLSDKTEQANLDLYINCTQNVTIFVKGPSDVHLSGYFEPKGDDMDDEIMYGEEEGDDEIEDDSDEEAPKAAVTKAIENNLKQAKINSNKNATSKVVAKAADSDDEGSDLDYDDEEGAEDLDDLDLDAEESEDESEEERPSPQKKAVPTKPQVVQDSDDDSDDADDQLADDNSDEDDSDEMDLEAIMKKARDDKLAAA